MGRYVAVLVTSVLLLAACGDSPTNDAGGGSDGTGGALTPEAVAEAEQIPFLAGSGDVGQQLDREAAER